LEKIYVKLRYYAVRFLHYASSSALADHPPAPEEIVGLLADPLLGKVVAPRDGVGRTPEREVSVIG
jgi:hypothetical protein